MRLRPLSMAFVAALMVLSLSAPLVAAQSVEVSAEGNTTNSTENATTATPAAQEPTYAGRVDNVVRVRSFSWSDGQMRVTLESDVPTLVVLSGLSTAQAGGEGVNDIPQKRVTVSPGVTTLTVDAADHGGSATVTVATSRNAVLLNSRTGSAWFYGSPDWSTVQAVGALAALIGGAAPALVAYRRKRSEQGEVRRLR